MASKIFLLLIIGFCSLVEAQPLKFSTSAKSAVMINPENGAILYEKDPDTPLYPASICKIATALFLLEGKKINLKDEVAASADAIAIVHANVKQGDINAFPSYRLEHDAKTLGLVSGEKLSAEMLLKAFLIYSANDAGNILAEHVSGDIGQFMGELNAYLKSVGCKGTHMTNPHGLYHPKQVTTASDMALLATLALKNRVFCEITTMPSFDLITSSKLEGIPLYHSNQLIRRGKYYYPKAIGLKIGYIGRIGVNIVAVAEDKGRRLIAVLIGCRKRSEMFEEVKTLFEKAFNEKLERRTLFSKAHDTFSMRVPKASQELQAELMSDITQTYFPAEEPKLSALIEWDGVALPIAKGQRVGEMRLVDESGKVRDVYPLFASEPLNISMIYQALAYWPWYLGGMGIVILIWLRYRRRRVWS